jgi:hypothetical protein
MKTISGVLGILGLCGLLMADSAAGLKWAAPAGWKSQGERPMRVATYSVPATKGDAEGGECAVFYFGQGQGGSVDANIKRWIGQIKQPDGKPSEKVAKTGKKAVNGLPVTTIDLSGTYAASMGPMAGGGSVNKPGYRLLGAIVEGPQGALFFKLTGPAKTVAASEAAFNGMVQSVKK